MKSFGILRTNVGLTTNIRITIDSDYNLSLDSIESNQNLSLDRYKKVKFNKKNYYDELLPFFFKETPSEIAFDIKYDKDIDTMGSDFKDQYDEIYQYGARNISNNKNYSEEFEYFAPLYVNKGGLPKAFVIFRVDGPGISYLTKENFEVDVLKRFKCVKVYDLSPNTSIGEWLQTNITKNNYFPNHPVEIDFRELEFCKWNGIDYQTGGYTSKSLFIDDILDEEKEIFELEKFVFDQFKTNKCAFANILNLNFLFDDEPATPEVKRKWSLNRYFGFYLDDLELVKSVSPYITPFLRDDVEILEGNILQSASNTDPFVNGWADTRPFYVEYKNNYYKVEKFTETLTNQLVQAQGNFPVLNSPNPGLINEQYQDVTVIRYRIISEFNLTGEQSELNKNYSRIDSNGVLIGYDNNPISIDDFSDYSIWLIEINGIYHNLISENSTIKLVTDFSFEFNENDYTYKLGGNTQKISFVVDNNNPPKKFNIYRAKFTDIKDFDTRIIDTEYSKFEYEKEKELTLTDETKMYVDNLRSNTDPKELDNFRLILDSNSTNEVVNIPVSSEYTANYETFKLENGDLSQIWRKNSPYCRWSFQGSLSANDYPYPLNNSLIFEDFNRTTNTFDPDPKRIERNLDYFYTINSSTSSYLHHSLHIEKLDSFGNIDTNFKFELDKYLNLTTYSIGTVSATYSFDYFTDFFFQKQTFLNGTINRNVKKYSEFNPGDESIPNNALFRGLKFRISDVESVDLNTIGEVQNINLKNSNKYDEYKISVLLSDNDLSVDNNGNLVDSSNTLQWSIVSQWKMDYDYATGSVVIFNDILYKSNTFVNTPQPTFILNFKEVKTAPYNQSAWSLYNPTANIFWSPPFFVGTSSYVDNDFIYNYGEYYSYKSTGTEDIWDPYLANASGYGVGEVVLFKGKYYQSTKAQNHYQPDYKTRHLFQVGQTFQQKRWWVATQSVNPKWNPIEVWSPIKLYTANKLVVHNSTIWLSSIDIEAGEIPGVSSYWTRKYSLEPDTDFIYSQLSNPVIEMNNSFYVCQGNNNQSTLDNGIVIYVNKKWKNILVNINISDNTMLNLRDSDRDSIYTDVYKKISASNVINSINDITNKFEFTDYVTYVIIDENNKITKHNFKYNIKNLPCLLEVDFPDEFNIKINSLTKKLIEKPQKLKPILSLSNGTIKNIDELNWYNNLPIAVEIIENKFEPRVFENFSGNKNFVNNQIFRHSGNYMPTFYDIQLFYKGMDDTSDNGKFDTTLTEFGIMKERKIRKINRTGSILKLKDDKDYKSIYPMLDEYGYTFRDFFIFSSTWDLQYHWETEILSKPPLSIEPSSITSDTVSNFGQPISYISNNQNQNL
jgi:hypothetical protein